jgi:hypothetical protein
MKSLHRVSRWLVIGSLGAAAMLLLGMVFAQESGKRPSSYAPVNLNEDFATVMARMKAAKPDIMKRHLDLLNERYDLSNRPAAGVTMSRGKPVQVRSTGKTSQRRHMGTTGGYDPGRNQR